MPTLAAERLNDFTVKMLKAVGSSDEEARIVADHLVLANLYGVDSHGVIRIPEYIDEIEKGNMKVKTTPKLVRETKATAVIDAGLGFGQVAAKNAMDLAIRKAQDYGVGGVTVHNCGHTGRIGAYPVMAAARNMIGIFYVKGGGGAVSPYGGKSNYLGTSPFSFAVPTGGEPMFADYATSASSEGKIRVIMSKGLQTPPGWLLDKNGKPTTNPADLYEGGTILTFGLHKGYALNLLIEAMGGALSGGGIAEEFAGANGVFAQAVNIEYYTPIEEFKARMDKLVQKMRTSPPQDGFSEVMVPGDPEYREMKKRRKDGIAINDKIWGDITKAAQRYSVAVPVT